MASEPKTDETQTPVRVVPAWEQDQPKVKQETITAHVCAPVGTRVPKASVLQTAIQSVRDAIPVVYKLDAEIVGSKTKEQDGQQVCEWEVAITYTPREVVGGKVEPVDVDKVLRGLDVPRSFDGIGSHEGDPDFLGR
jgi:hypothetical protein